MDQRYEVGRSDFILLVVGVLSALVATGALWLLLEANTRRRLRKSIESIGRIDARNDWSDWLVDAARVSTGTRIACEMPDTIHQLQRADADGIWALSERAEAILDRDAKAPDGHEILAECALRVTTLCSSQTFFSGDPWRLMITATVYARCRLQTRARQLIARVRDDGVQRRVMTLPDRQLVGYLYLLRVLNSYQFDTSELQTVATVQLESRLLDSLDEEGTAALPTVLQNRAATRAAERILRGTAPVSARRIAAWALARGTE